MCITCQSRQGTTIFIIRGNNLCFCGTNIISVAQSFHLILHVCQKTFRKVESTKMTFYCEVSVIKCWIPLHKTFPKDLF